MRSKYIKPSTTPRVNLAPSKTRSIEPDFVREALGAEEVCKENEKICIIDRFFAEENKKPVYLRKNYYMIYCSCRKCRPITF